MVLKCFEMFWMYAHIANVPSRSGAKFRWVQPNKKVNLLESDFAICNLRLDTVFSDQKKCGLSKIPMVCRHGIWVCHTGHGQIIMRFTYGGASSEQPVQYMFKCSTSPPLCCRPANCLVWICRAWVAHGTKEKPPAHWGAQHLWGSPAWRRNRRKLWRCDEADSPGLAGGHGKVDMARSMTYMCGSRSKSSTKIRRYLGASVLPKIWVVPRFPAEQLQQVPTLIQP